MILHPMQLHLHLIMVYVLKYLIWGCGKSEYFYKNTMGVEEEI